MLPCSATTRPPSTSPSNRGGRPVTLLARALDKFKPELVVACYGMNDGIYYPFSDERFAAYRRGLDKLIEKVHAAGAKLVLLAPPPFDPVPLKPKGKLLPADAEKFAWFEIYEGYDDVLARYAAHVMSLKDRVAMTIDLHTPVNDYLAEKRKTEPGFTLAGDGIHPNAEGHALIARAILTAWRRDRSAAACST